jgi:hypothetical protein
VIDFRYHLVSIVAVFLALAIGIVVGSTALKPAVLSGLQKTADAEKKRIDALYAQNNLNKQQIAADQAYAQAGEHQMLSGLLDGSHLGARRGGRDRERPGAAAEPVLRDRHPVRPGHPEP